MLLFAGAMSGSDVINQAGEDLGRVEELMFDTSTGEVEYVVLASGASMSVDEKLFAIPWRAIVLDPVEERFLLDASMERLRRAPCFERDCWPEATRDGWRENVASYWEHHE